MNFRHFVPVLLSIVGGVLVSPYPAFATLRPSFYFPNDRFCAVYQGNIEAEHAFTLWIDMHQKLTITLDRELKVAVIQQGKVVPAFTISPHSSAEQLEQSFRLMSSGNHQIVVRGLARDTTITFCLR